MVIFIVSLENLEIHPTTPFSSIMLTNIDITANHSIHKTLHTYLYAFVSISSCKLLSIENCVLHFIINLFVLNVIYVFVFE